MTLIKYIYAGIEDTYKRSCVLHDDSVKCHEQFNREEECLANQCVWEYYRRKHKQGEQRKKRPYDDTHSVYKGVG